MTTPDPRFLPPVEPLRSLPHRYGLKLVDLALPGDEHTIIKYKLMQSLKREMRLNEAELEVYNCTRVKLMYSTPTCLARHCGWCGGDGWREEDYLHSGLYDKWP